MSSMEIYKNENQYFRYTAFMHGLDNFPTKHFLIKTWYVLVNTKMNVIPTKIPVSGYLHSYGIAEGIEVY